MYHYGRKSSTQLSTLHPHLQHIFTKVLETDDHSVDQGGRTFNEQWDLFNADPPRTTLHPPDGKHLIQSDGWAYAADITPWLNGKRLVTSEEGFGPYQMAQFAWFLRKVKEVGAIYLARIEQDTGQKWKLRFGIDWDGDGEILTDQKFQDWFHVELIREA